MMTKRHPEGTQLKQRAKNNEPSSFCRKSELYAEELNGLTTVELFCGIGGFRVAADRLGIKTLWANDFSPLACKVYRERFSSDVLREGDIAELVSEIPEHDILTGGFPCQPFSAAGKKKGIRDARGTLFQTIVDVVRERQPRYFVLENVKRLLSMELGTHFATVLSALTSLGYFVEWRVLNAKHFGLAQNRERVVILGTRVDGYNRENFHAYEKIRLSELAYATPGIDQILRDVGSWRKLDKHRSTFPNWGVAFGAFYVAHELNDFLEKIPTKSLLDVLEENPGEEYDYTAQTLNRLHMNEVVDRYVNGVEIVSNQSGGARMGYTIFGANGIAPTLTASTSRHYERYKIGDRYRRLSPIEYARIQGFADNHCSAVRGYDQYALLGNAVPPPMIEWVLRKVLSNPSVSSMRPVATQKDLFCVQ